MKFEDPDNMRTCLNFCITVNILKHKYQRFSCQEYPDFLDLYFSQFITLLNLVFTFQIIVH